MKQQSLLLTALGGYMAHLRSHSEASGGMRRGGGVGESRYTLRLGSCASIVVSSGGL